MHASTKISVAILIAAAFVGGIFFATGTDIFSTSRSVANEAPDPAAYDALPPLETGTTTELSSAFSTVAQTVRPSVVQVTTTVTPEVEERANPFEGTPFEDFFQFPERRGELPPRTGLGSGVIIRSDGYIVTNNHVVRNAEDVEVVLADGTRYEAEIVGTDPYSDLAVLHIEADDLDPVPYANMESIEVGEWVMAIGSPYSLQLGSSVTVGIVSAMGRSNFPGLALPAAGEFEPVQNFIQTDAAINPGNSGGALVDLHGRLVGINTAIVSQSGGNVGIGFAIPVGIVRNVVSQIIEQGYVARGYLGIRFGRVSTALAEALDVTPGAAQVIEVVPGTPAAEAGLQQGDIIVALNGTTLENINQLSNIVAGLQPGDELEITYVRDDERETVTVELAERPEEEELAQQEEEEEGVPGEASFEELGIELATLTPQLRQQLGLEAEVEGVLVSNVDPSSMAFEEAELREGYIITAINGERTASIDDFQEIYGEIEPGEYFRVQIAIPTQEGLSSYLTALIKPS